MYYRGKYYPSIDEFFGPGLCSLCVNLLILVTLNSQWRAQEGVIWLSDFATDAATSMTLLDALRAPRLDARNLSLVKVGRSSGKEEPFRESAPEKALTMGETAREDADADAFHPVPPGAINDETPPPRSAASSAADPPAVQHLAAQAPASIASKTTLPTADALTIAETVDTHAVAPEAVSIKTGDAQTENHGTVDAPTSDVQTVNVRSESSKTVVFQDDARNNDFSKTHPASVETAFLNASAVEKQVVLPMALPKAIASASSPLSEPKPEAAFQSISASAAHSGAAKVENLPPLQGVGRGGDGARESVTPPPAAFGAALVASPGGELVLDVTSKDVVAAGIRIHVVYRSYPKALHQKAMSLAESKHVKELATKMILVAKDTLEAALDTAADGIYDFVGTSQSGGPVDVDCAISFRGTRKKIGARKVDNEATIVRILLPEGIVWDDASQFDGAIEDTESITKYRTDTGLVWKEYK